MQTKPQSYGRRQNIVVRSIFAALSELALSKICFSSKMYFLFTVWTLLFAERVHKKSSFKSQNLKFLKDWKYVKLKTIKSVNNIFKKRASS